jgi:hypothetical protein
LLGLLSKLVKGEEEEGDGSETDVEHCGHLECCMGDEIIEGTLGLGELFGCAWLMLFFAWDVEEWIEFGIVGHVPRGPHLLHASKEFGEESL